MAQVPPGGSYSPSDIDEYPTFPKSSSPTRLGPEFELEKTIPHTNEHRTLVCCFDGTGDQFDDENSNVINFFTMLKKDDSSRQLVYYQAGIGTYTIPEIAHPKLAKFHRAVDAMLGSHLNAHVMGGYEFLMQNYQFGDKICLFGFSRGAYTARALSGMLHKVGLLPKCNHQQVPFAYKMYSREDETGWRQSTAFKKAFSIDVSVEMLGVWDTVSAVGFIPKQLPFTRSNTHVRYFRHALALDEHRARFQPNFWQRSSPEELRLGVQPGEMPKSGRKSSKNKSLSDLETQYSDGGRYETDVEEVWFAGCHYVGGGALPNAARNSLARIPIRWMIRQCFLLETGILFHRDMLRLVGIDPGTLHPRVSPRPPPLLKTPKESQRSGTTFASSSLTECDFRNEEEEDLADALTPIHDELKRRKIWWILEILPQQLRYQENDDSWTQKLAVHRGHGRHIPRQETHGVKIHRTVKMRMDALGYHPKAKLKPTTKLTWVD